MKKLISLLLIAALVLSMTGCAAEQNNVTEPYATEDVVEKLDDALMTDFALRLFQQSAEKNGNTLISPLSVLYALAMTANGAGGDTLSQMEYVLGGNVEGLNQWLREYREFAENQENLHLANSLWLREMDNFHVNEDFLQTNRDVFDAEIFQKPFDAKTCRELNDWVSRETDGMIQDILDEIPEDALMYLVNALAFEAKWQNPYRTNQIRDGFFTTYRGVRRPVEMMHSEEKYYLEDQYATGFLKYYEGGRYAFAAILPNQEMALEEYLEILTGVYLQQLLSNVQEESVQVTLPKFTQEYEVQMSHILKAMGMCDAFDAHLADFSGIGTSDAGNLYINRVLHKTYLAVDEEGTRAGAATAVEMETRGVLVDKIKQVILDRPFLYMIVDMQANLPVFIGTMMDPAGKSGADSEEALAEPPEMTAAWIFNEMNVGTGNYSWLPPQTQEPGVGITACGVHPLDGALNPEYAVISGDWITLSFPVAPDKITVCRWSDAVRGYTRAAEEAVELSGTSFRVEEGKWIYRVTVSWQGDTWSGQAEYHLYLEK